MSRSPVLEQRVRGWLDPVISVVDRTGLTPNALTVLGLWLNFGAAGVVATGHLRWGAVAFLGASLFDMLDGGLARRRGQSSDTGAFLDSTFDRLSEAALFLALLHDALVRPYGPDFLPHIILIALAGSLSTSYARARAEGLGQSCKVGWLERPERVILLTLGLLASREILAFCLAALAVLSWITVLQRIHHVRKGLDQRARDRS